MTEGIKLPKKENIRMLGEKQIYVFLEILEADTIKQAVMKEKVKINSTWERENGTKLNSSSSSSSSCRAASTDIPDLLSPRLPIIHLLWVTSRIIT